MTDITYARPRVRGPKLLLTAAIAVTLAIGMLTMAGSTANAGGNGNGNGNPTPGAADRFAVLAGTAVDCTRSSVTGDVGISPGIAFAPTSCDITGTVHKNDAAAQAAMSAFLTAYGNYADKACTDTVTLTTVIAAPLTLTPGVYCNTGPAGVTFTDTTLTLQGNGNANAVWIFKTVSLTATDLSVVMSRSGNPCNVTWWTGAGATITSDDAGIPHPFIGTILAGGATGAITTTGTTSVATDRLSFTGDAFAKNGVTLTDTNLVGCAGGRPGGGGDDDDDDNDNDNDNDDDDNDHNDNHNDNHNDKDKGDKGHHDD
ncbi:MAG: ice-binding family protein [Chloroflexota bacterium]|nr:ice-binding family protein [Chloroflexota bacterium]